VVFSAFLWPRIGDGVLAAANGEVNGIGPNGEVDGASAAWARGRQRGRGGSGVGERAARGRKRDWSRIAGGDGA
jgi:hypothetical protein